MTVILGDAARDTHRIQLTLNDNPAVVDSMQAMIGYVDEHDDEDLVIIGPDAPMSLAAELAEKYRLERPTLGVILMRRRVEISTMAEALRAGIREVVLADDAEALAGACGRSRAVSRQMRLQERRTGDTHRARVMLLFSAKGGCGKTTLATNLAEALAELDEGRVCLVDFNLEFGDVAIALQVEPVRTISDALGMQGGLDQHGVASMVIPYRDRFDVLLAPTQPADAEFITADLAGEILGLLAEMYDFIVIDTSSAFSDVMLKCFDIADSYVLLTTLDMLALKNFKVTLDTLDALGYPRSRWNIVLNRCDSRVGLTPEDMEKVIGVSICAQLPSSRDVPASLNKGVTLMADSPRHPFSRAVLDLARTLAHEVRTPVVPVRRSGLFRRRSA